MKTVCICGSRRFESEIRKFAKELSRSGVVVYEPILNQDRRIDKLPENLKRYAFLGLTHHHFSFIKKADVVYMFNKGGYLGNSGTMELGFAEALGKPIYALCEDREEPCRNVLFDEIVKTPKKLINKLK
ncbi:MAG: nucleoside 2-deoxyribosyltransferase [bacterium]|nr:nucleoside 2-deoxyribosyltransferase [bacterium]